MLLSVAAAASACTAAGFTFVRNEVPAETIVMALCVVLGIASLAFAASIVVGVVLSIVVVGWALYTARL
ncbi:hypothetical protein AB0I46_33570 [Streptomyces spectabilis]